MHSMDDHCWQVRKALIGADSGSEVESYAYPLIDHTLEPAANSLTESTPRKAVPNISITPNSLSRPNTTFGHSCFC